MLRCFGSKAGHDAPACSGYAIVALTFIFAVVLIIIMKATYMAGYRFPLMMTFLNMAATHCASTVYYSLRKWKQDGDKKVLLSVRQRIRLILPISVCHVGALGCANIALLMAYPSFVAMVSAAIPAMTLLVSIVCKVQGDRSVWQWVAMVPIIGGTVLTSFAEVDLNVLALILVLLSLLLRSIKLVLQSKVLRGLKKQMGPARMLYYSSPINAALFLVWSLAQEGIAPWVALGSATLSQGLLIAASTLVATMFNLLTLQAVAAIDVTLLTVLNRLKAPVTATLSYLFFAHPIGWRQILGFSITMGGVILYHAKARKNKKTATPEDVRLEDEPACCPRDFRVPTIGSLMHLDQHGFMGFDQLSVSSADNLDVNQDEVTCAETEPLGSRSKVMIWLGKCQSADNLLHTKPPLNLEKWRQRGTTDF